MIREEQIIQQQCVRWFRIQHPDKVLFAVKNNSFGSGISNKRMGAIDKSMGVLAGVSDLVFVYNDMVYFIEMKTEKGTQSEPQKDFQENVEGEGMKYIIVRSFDKFVNLITNIVNYKK